jgi:hypothetical protein
VFVLCAGQQLLSVLDADEQQLLLCCVLHSNHASMQMHAV